MGQRKRERGKSSKTKTNTASHVVLDLKRISTTKVVTIMYKDIHLRLKPSVWCVCFMFTIILIRIVRWMHHQVTRTARTSRRRKDKEIEEVLGISHRRNLLQFLEQCQYQSVTCLWENCGFVTGTVSASALGVIFQSDQEFFGNVTSSVRQKKQSNY